MIYTLKFEMIIRNVKSIYEFFFVFTIKTYLCFMKVSAISLLYRYLKEKLQRISFNCIDQINNNVITTDY